MPLPIHHLKHLHHRIRHHLTTVIRPPFSVFVVSATLILMPLALSPVSSDPATAGQTALLLVATIVLYLILSVRVVREQMTEKQINGEETPFLRSSVLRPPLTVLTALVLILIMIATSANHTLALSSPQAKVILVLLFFLAAKKLLRGNLEGSPEVASLLRKAWVAGLVISGLLYLVFASPISPFLAKTMTGQSVLVAPWMTATRLIAPQFNPIRPDWQTSVKVATETLVHSPLLGAGLGHYASAFSAYRGAGFNASPLWNAKISTSFSTLFNWVTEGGILGLIIYLLLFLPAFNLVFTFVKLIFNLKFKIFNQFEMTKLLKIKSFKIKSLISNFKLQILNYKAIGAVLALSSLFFPFSLVGYFYLITGYLFIYEN